MHVTHAPVIAALVAFSAIAVGSAGRVGRSAQSRLAGPEHARLAAMCGTWDVEMTLWPRPGGASVAITGTSAIRPLLDGLFIEETIEGSLNGAAFTTLAWTGYNTFTRQYEATRLSSTNPGRIAEAGVFDERTGQLELKGEYVLAGETWRQRTVIRQTSADAMVAASYLSFGTVPEWQSVEIRYTRRSK